MQQRRSLDDIQQDFNAQIGHLPHTVGQMINFCKQEKQSWKYSEIKKWWPTRPDATSKPQKQAINQGAYRAKLLEEEEYFVDACYLIKTCKSLKRLCLAMQFFANTTSQSLLVEYFTKYKHILNDYGHIVYHHLNDANPQKQEQSFNLIFNELNKEIQCNLDTCNQYKRYITNREQHTDAQQPSQDTQIAFYTDLMDTIHCHLLHSYDTGFRINVNTMHSLQASTQNDSISAVPSNHSMNATHRFLRDKSETFLTSNSHNNRKGRYTSKTSDCQQHQTEQKEEHIEQASHILPRFHFGDMHRFYYWDYYKENENEDKEHNLGYKYSDWYIVSHFDNLKNEMLSEYVTIAITNYEISAYKAQRYHQTEHVKCITARHRACSEHYGFAQTALNEYRPECVKLPAFTEEHLLSIILFTDYNDLSALLKQSFIKTSLSEQDETLKRRNSYFANWSRLLREAVEVFGDDTKSAPINTFYHTLDHTDSLPFVHAFEVRLTAPTSLTTQIPVAMMLNEGNLHEANGVVLDLQPFRTDIDLSFFNCSFFSRFGNEYEKLVIGGCGMMQIGGINLFDAHLQEWQNYKYCIRALQFYESMLNGTEIVQYKVDSITNREFAIISDLAAYELGTERKRKYADYIHRLFSMYCQQKTSVFIDLSRTNHLYECLSFLNGTTYADYLLPLHEIAMLYKNCERIVLRKEQVIVVFADFWLHFLKIVDRLNKAECLQSIELCGVYMKCTMEEMTEFERKLRDKHWRIQLQVYDTKFNDLRIVRCS